MTPAEKLVEVVARACCLDGEADYKNSDGVTFWEFYRDDAVHIIRAIEAAGWQIVSGEVTENMMKAGEYAWMHRDLNDDDSNPLKDCYRAMLAAAPKVQLHHLATGDLDPAISDFAHGEISAARLKEIIKIWAQGATRNDIISALPSASERSD